MTTRIQRVVVRVMSIFLAFCSAAICWGQVYPLPGAVNSAEPIVHASDDNLYTIAESSLGATPWELFQLTTPSGAIDYGYWNGAETPLLPGPNENFWQGVADFNILNPPPPNQQQWTVSQIGLAAGDFPSTVGTGVNFGAPLLVDRDGFVWMRSETGLFKVNPATEQAAIVYTYPTNLSGQVESVTGAALGRDGSVWFTSYTGNYIGVISPGGAVTTYAVPTQQAALGGIALGSDGNMWFTEGTSGSSGTGPSQVGKITASGAITEYPVSTPYGVLGFQPMTGPEGDIWIYDAQDIMRVTPSTGAVQVFSPPLGPGKTPAPNELVVGPDARIWFPDQYSNVEAISIQDYGGYPAPFGGFSGYSTLSGSAGFLFTTDFDATAQSGEPPNAGYAARRTLWWRWTAPSSGQVIFGTSGSSYETVMGAYTGTSLSSLTRVAQNHVAGNGVTYLAFDVTSGTTYNVVVDGVNGTRGALLLDYRMTTATTAVDMKLSGPSTAYQGQDYNYTMTVNNTGPAYATNVVATLTLGVNETYVSASPGCTYNSTAKTVTCTQGTLTTEQPAVYTVTVVDSVDGNTAASANVTETETNPDPSQASGSVGTTISTAPPPPPKDDAPTLPEWAAILLGAVLLATSLRNMGRRKDQFI